MDSEKKNKSSNKSTMIKLVITAVILGIVVLAMIPAFVAGIWVPACAGCHTTLDKSMNAASHMDVKDIECMSCHGGEGGMSSYLFRIKVLYGMALPIYPVTVDAVVVSDSQCLRCHEKALKRGVKTSNGIWINHSSCAEGTACSVCHSTIGHELANRWSSQYAMNQCIRCHVENNAGTAEDCDQCHNGRHTSPQGKQNSSFAIVHGPDWQSTHGMGDVATCNACHETYFCGKCHGEGVPHDARLILRDHGAIAVKSDNKCGTCHKNQSFCDTCHGLEMPHAKGYLKIHAKDAEGASREKCNKCHVAGDCRDCHSAHIHPGGAKEAAK